MARAILAAVGTGLLDYALPPRCPGCGVVVAGAHRFCLDCWRGLDFLGGPACARCGDPFPDGFGEGMCARCADRPPAYDAMAAAVAYGAAARALALRLKYAGRPGVAGTMARQMARLVEGQAGGEGAVLVPVPLHRWRLWRRGYNQAALVARALGRRTGLAVDVDLLVRTRATPPMKGLGPRERARLVHDVFAVPRADRAAGRRVILVDDVYTTGATADACARALKRAGAAHVRVVCWARVVRAGGDAR